MRERDRWPRSSAIRLPPTRGSRGLDPRAAEAVHANDQRRLVRALELAETGASLVPDDDRLWASATRHPTVIVGLEVPPDELERRIVARTEAMFEQGVVGGGAGRARSGVSRTAAKTLGLDEIATLPEAEARERIVIRTRRYAAYQRKWMRRIPGIVPVDGTGRSDEIADAVLGAASAVA